MRLTLSGARSTFRLNHVTCRVDRDDSSVRCCADSRNRTFRNRTFYYPRNYPLRCVRWAPSGALVAGTPIAIDALRTSCEDVEESSMMRAKVRVLSRTRKQLKNMKKIDLVPGRGLEP